jgi:hypothetical protein
MSLLQPSDSLWSGLFELAHPDKRNYFEHQANSVVDLGVKEPLGQIVPRTRAFVRQCYMDLFAKVMDVYKAKDRVTVSLTGTPGIGKSMFGLLFVVDLIRHLSTASASKPIDSKFGLGLSGCIVYEHVTFATPTFYLIDAVNKRIAKSYSKPQEWLDDRHAFLVKDGPCETFDVECSVLWLSSPRAGSFQKTDELKANVFILPPWTPDELVACWQADCAPAQLLNIPTTSDANEVRLAVAGVNSRDDLEGDELNKAIVRRWIADLGPVARRVFNPVKGYQYLKAAIDDMGDGDLKGIVGHATSQSNSTSTNKFKYSHRLLLMVPSSDFKSYVFSPSSVDIGRRILAKTLEDDIINAESLMGKMRGARLGLCEPYARYMRAVGGDCHV